MKVKIGELKDQLSHYLRIVRETGQDVEVCVRDEPVAMLQSMERAVRTPPDVVVTKLRERLLAAGLVWQDAAAGDEALPVIEAKVAGDGVISDTGSEDWK